MNNYNTKNHSENFKKIKNMYFGDFLELFDTDIRRNHFSLFALRSIYEYLNEVAPELVPDAVSICCEFTEESPADIVKAHGIDLSDLDEEDEDKTPWERLEVVREYLEENTTVLNKDFGDTEYRFIYVAF